MTPWSPDRVPGEVYLDGWVSEAPDNGEDTAMLAMSTDSPDAAQVMAQLLGQIGAPVGGASLAVPGLVAWLTTPELWVVIGDTSGGMMTKRPVTPAWAAAARAGGRVVLLVSHVPHDLARSVCAEMREAGDDFTVVIIPVTTRSAGGVS